MWPTESGYLDACIFCHGVRRTVADRLRDGTVFRPPAAGSPRTPGPRTTLVRTRENSPSVGTGGVDAVLRDHRRRRSRQAPARREVHVTHVGVAVGQAARSLSAERSAGSSRGLVPWRWSRAVAMSRCRRPPHHQHPGLQIVVPGMRSGGCDRCSMERWMCRTRLATSWSFGAICQRPGHTRAPDRLGKKAAEVHPNLGQCPERAQIGVLPRRRLRIRHPGHPGGKVAHAVHYMTRRKQPASEFCEIEPLERGALEGSVVQVETVDTNTGSHGRGAPKKQEPPRGAALEPTARCRRVSGRTLRRNGEARKSVSTRRRPGLGPEIERVDLNRSEHFAGPGRAPSSPTGRFARQPPGPLPVGPVRALRDRPSRHSHMDDLPRSRLRYARSAPPHMGLDWHLDSRDSPS